MSFSAIQNFQIPVKDFNRAHAFYSTLLGYELEVIEAPEFKLGIFRFDQEKGVGGCIIENEKLEPSKKGTMVYLQTGEDLQPFVDRIKDTDGNVFVEKTELGPGMGFYSIIEDSEGNHVGLYSTN